MIDLHAHLLPGLDDGPPALDASAEMAAAAVAAGTDVMAATSHVNRSFGLRPAQMAAARREVNARLATSSAPLCRVRRQEPSERDWASRTRARLTIVER